MPLPSLIEIEPVPAPVRADITVPGSKSITNRALILAALATGSTTLEGALWSEDTQVMVQCLQQLGFAVEVHPDPREFANRTITVAGQGGHIPRAGNAADPLDLFVGNAGTAARFLAAFVCLGSGAYRLHGVPRMHERPQAELFSSLRALGYEVESPNGFLPAIIHGRGGRHPGRCTVSLTESSQFASALLLTAPVAGWEIQLAGENCSDEAPYVVMTERLVAAFPKRGGRVAIEPDASSGSYFWGANTLLGGGIRVNGWPSSGWQIDAEFPRLLPLPDRLSRERDLGDAIMTAIVLGPLATHPVQFTELGRLRVQECERVRALRTELTKCGARISESGDTLTIEPGPLHGAEIATYHDHRMAMCFATLGLRVPGIRLRDPACVKKTFPNFFQKLSTPAPDGLGAIIRDGLTGRRLENDDLFAA
jgi:3-phosphoshikimate 1-carboxyvinyltransferase